MLTVFKDWGLGLEVFRDLTSNFTNTSPENSEESYIQELETTKIRSGA